MINFAENPIISQFFSNICDWCFRLLYDCRNDLFDLVGIDSNFFCNNRRFDHRFGIYQFSILNMAFLVSINSKITQQHPGPCLLLHHLYNPLRNPLLIGINPNRRNHNLPLFISLFFPNHLPHHLYLLLPPFRLRHLIHPQPQLLHLLLHPLLLHHHTIPLLLHKTLPIPLRLLPRLALLRFLLVHRRFDLLLFFAHFCLLLQHLLLFVVLLFVLFLDLHAHLLADMLRYDGLDAGLVYAQRTGDLPDVLLDVVALFGCRQRGLLVGHVLLSEQVFALFQQADDFRQLFLHLPLNYHPLFDKLTSFFLLPRSCLVLTHPTGYQIPFYLPLLRFQLLDLTLQRLHSLPQPAVLLLRLLQLPRHCLILPVQSNQRRSHLFLCGEALVEHEVEMVGDGFEGLLQGGFFGFGQLLALELAEEVVKQSAQLGGGGCGLRGVRPVLGRRFEDLELVGAAGKTRVSAVHIWEILYSGMRMVSWLWKGTTADEDNEEELKKKGFDPQNLEVGVAAEQAITDFSKDYEGWISPSQEELAKLIHSYKFFDNDVEHRHELAHPKGGRNCADKNQVTKIRAIGKEMIKIIGKKIISGDFNLTKVSFPIKAMVPKTALQNCTFGTCMFPIFISKAALSPSPIDRMRLFITSTISSFYYMNLFLKPLNPILGQTLQGSYSDGTQVYLQQISHHPPISYLLITSPHYKYYGHYHYQAKAGLNSMTLVNKGHRVLEFPNGEKIRSTFSKDTFSGVFLGTMRSEVVGEIEFVDERNDVRCVVQFGKVKNKPSDYFSGRILSKGKVVSNVSGTYLGFVNVDDVRYWDGRFMHPIKVDFEKEPLESDFSKRMDLRKLKEYRITEAQAQKDRLEDLQRHDAKLRKNTSNHK